ncbi:MAG: hypothetical protein ABIT01_20475 [Thermoanaerobaculia bacterium]
MATRKSNGADPDHVLWQAIAAFGQGTGMIRISRDAVAALEKRYRKVLPEVAKDWERESHQVLERLRLIGRAAAANALQHGKASVSAEDFEVAAKLYSGTAWCPL